MTHESRKQHSVTCRDTTETLSLHKIQTETARNDCFTSFISPTVNNKNSSYIKSQHVCCLQEPGEEKLTRHELCFIRRFTHLRAQNRCWRQMLAADAVHSGISKGLVWMTLNATLTELNCSKHPEKWRETNSSLQQMRLRSARAETSEQLQQRTSAGSPGPLLGLPDLCRVSRTCRVSRCRWTRAVAVLHTVCKSVKKQAICKIHANELNARETAGLLGVCSLLLSELSVLMKNSNDRDLNCSSAAHFHLLLCFSGPWRLQVDHWDQVTLTSGL